MQTLSDTKQHEIDWYFDFISPFAYFQHHRLVSSHPDIKINYYPILFGAVLQKHGHKGPAEIPAKRIMTYRYCTWLARKLTIPFQFPEVHPYKPVSVLRLAIAAGVNTSTVTDIFWFIWADGKDPSDPENLQQLATRLGVENYQQAIQQENIKNQLRSNTDRASALGMFGVPTIVIEDQLFWGQDLTDMAMEYLNDKTIFNAPEYESLNTIPNGLEG